MSHNLSFAHLSDSQRQSMAEVWMINYVYQQNAYAVAAHVGDRVLVREISDAAVARFRNEMHIDLRGLTLTDQGFRPQG